MSFLLLSSFQCASTRCPRALRSNFLPIAFALTGLALGKVLRAFCQRLVSSSDKTHGGLKWTRTTDKITYALALLAQPLPVVTFLSFWGSRPAISRLLWWAQVDSNHRQDNLCAHSRSRSRFRSSPSLVFGDRAPAIFRLLWWAQVDSNHRPHAYQACALTC